MRHMLVCPSFSCAAITVTNRPATTMELISFDTCHVFFVAETLDVLKQIVPQSLGYGTHRFAQRLGRPTAPVAAPLAIHRDYAICRIATVYF